MADYCKEGGRKKEQLSNRRDLYVEQTSLQDNVWQTVGMQSIFLQGINDIIRMNEMNGENSVTGRMK